MIGIEVLVTQLPGLHREDLERWILNEWVRPDVDAGRFTFREMDLARVRLILELRDDLKVNEDALPIVLSLLDQLYDMRRRMRELGNAVHETTPEELRQNLVERLLNQAR